LKIVGSNISNPEAFTFEVREQLSEIKILQRGVESGLVCRPEILLEAIIDEATTSTGKLKKVVYAADW
jgi:hypothetical protein